MLEMQQSYETTIARKENEIAGLLESLKDTKVTRGGVINTAQLEEELTSEFEKRKIAEEKIRTTLNELAQSHELTQMLQSQLEEAKNYGKGMEAALRRREEEIMDNNRRDKIELSKLRKRLADCEVELTRRPPVTFENLIEKIGVFASGASSPIYELSELEKGVVWSELESFIVDSMRRMSSEAAESRVREAEASKRLGQALVQVWWGILERKKSQNSQC